MIPRVFATICLFVLSALPVRADGPEEMVTWIYSTFAGVGAEDAKGTAYLARPDQRANYFSDRMVAFLEANESYLAQNLPGCISYPMEAAGPDYDPAEMLRTLTLDSIYQANRQIVTASFYSGGVLSRVKFHFTDVDGIWKIDDVAAGNRRISFINCQTRGTEAAPSPGQKKKKAPAEVAPYGGDAVAYCYLTSGEQFVLDVAADGSADLWLKSAQPTGHKCEVKGPAKWAGTGWLFEQSVASGACRLEILITAQSGLRFVDEDFNCKPTFCGPSAKLDGLNFERDSQINCTYLRME